MNNSYIQIRFINIKIQNVFAVQLVEKLHIYHVFIDNLLFITH